MSDAYCTPGCEPRSVAASQRLCGRTLGGGVKEWSGRAWRMAAGVETTSFHNRRYVGIVIICIFAGVL